MLKGTRYSVELFINMIFIQFLHIYDLQEFEQCLWLKFDDHRYVPWRGRGRFLWSVGSLNRWFELLKKKKGGADVGTSSSDASRSPKIVWTTDRKRKSETSGATSARAPPSPLGNETIEETGPRSIHSVSPSSCFPPSTRVDANAHDFLSTRTGNLIKLEMYSISKSTGSIECGGSMLIRYRAAPTHHDYQRR